MSVRGWLDSLVQIIIMFSFLTCQHPCQTTLPETISVPCSPHQMHILVKMDAKTVHRQLTFDMKLVSGIINKGNHITGTTLLFILLMLSDIWETASDGFFSDILVNLRVHNILFIYSVKIYDYMYNWQSEVRTWLTFHTKSIQDSKLQNWTSKLLSCPA